MPNLKYRSSPLAVLPPTYHFSPKSLKPPSLLVSLPLLALLNPPPPLGGDIACGLLELDGGEDLAGADGEVEAWRAWERDGLAAWTAAVVGPAEGDLVAMARERVGGA